MESPACSLGSLLNSSQQSIEQIKTIVCVSLSFARSFSLSLMCVLRWEKWDSNNKKKKVSWEMAGTISLQEPVIKKCQGHSNCLFTNCHKLKKHPQWGFVSFDWIAEMRMYLFVTQSDAESSHVWPIFSQPRQSAKINKQLIWKTLPHITCPLWTFFNDDSSMFPITLAYQALCLMGAKANMP